jgi:hypothetical protein
MLVETRCHAGLRGAASCGELAFAVRSPALSSFDEAPESKT